MGTNLLAIYARLIIKNRNSKMIWCILLQVVSLRKFLGCFSVILIVKFVTVVISRCVQSTFYQKLSVSMYCNYGET